MSRDRPPTLVGVLVTFRRPEYLPKTLDKLGQQDRRLDRLIVVDNEATDEARLVVEGHPTAAETVEYLPTKENLGFAGGVATGMTRALAVANERGWIVVLDDDDPPSSSTVLGELERFGSAMVAQDPRTAAVGLTGARFDWRGGRIRRVPDSELHGAVPVDYVSGGNLPFYLVRAVRESGTFWTPLFFGLSEIEYGLRLRRMGYTLYGHGDLWLRGRAKVGRLNTVTRPRLRLPELRWRRYYTLRNTIYVLRQHGHRGAAVRVTLLRGLAKPVANLFINPRAALRHLALNWRACRDGWAGRMGRTVEPDARSRRELVGLGSPS
jgi:glycosyltransferase involved in cell wall biosynthesis